MQRERNEFELKMCRSMGAALLLALSLTGCRSHLSAPAVTLQNATAPVVDQAEAAYRGAVELHDVRVDYDAAAQFDKPGAKYDPKGIVPLLSSSDVDVRLATLSAFQLYTSSLVEITSGTSSPALDAASISVGTSLSNLGNTVGTTFASALNPSATTDAPPISVGTQNAISTAFNALGRFLVNRQIKRFLPDLVEKMDPTVDSLCKLLEKDIDILQSQEKLDYGFILNQQDLFIRNSSSNGLTGEDRRDQIMKLPGFVRQWRSTDGALTQLRAAVVKLASTHHALAVQAGGNNQETVREKLADLVAAGSDLGKFYSSLPTS